MEVKLYPAILFRVSDDVLERLRPGNCALTDEAKLDTLSSKPSLYKCY